MSFADDLRKAKVDEELIEQIMSVDYTKDEADPYQDAANFYAAAIPKCEEVIGFDALSEVMFGRACCKSGYRLNNARQLAKEHGDKTLEEKLVLLGELRYMGKPRLNDDGDIESDAVGTPESCSFPCPCWQIKRRVPDTGPMPLNYCLCCAGHFRFHYQKALGLKLRVKKVVSTIMNSSGKLPCVFVFQIV